MILGHIPSAMVTARLISRRWPGLVAVFFLAFLPDIFDKSLFMVFGLTSRGYFHSLVLLGVLWAVLRSAAFTRPYANVLCACWLVHVLCDFVRLKSLLWPFSFLFGEVELFPSMEAGAFDFLGVCRRFYIDIAYPWWLALEVFWTLACLLVFVRDRRRA